MCKSRLSEEQIIGILKRVAAGQPIADVCREIGISDGCLYERRRGRSAGAARGGCVQPRRSPLYSLDDLEDIAGKKGGIRQLLDEKWHKSTKRTHRAGCLGAATCEQRK